MKNKYLSRLLIPAIITVIAVALAFSVYGCLKSRAFRRPVAYNRMEVIGFYENGSSGQPSSEQSLRQNIGAIDTVVPVWASVDHIGNITNVTSSREVQNFVHQNNRPMVVLLTNLRVPNRSNWASIETKDLRMKTARNITAFVVQNGYDGAHIAFDVMPPAAKQAFSSFIQDLARELHAKDKILGVSVYPALELPASLWGAYDYAQIGKFADYVVLQGYERNTLTGPPGPVAPDPWVESSIQKTLKDIPAKKLVLGIGAYGYDWAETAGEGVTEYLSSALLARRAREAGVTPKLDKKSHQATYTYTISETKRVVWFQDVENVKSKMAMARKYGLRGVSLWRLGFEQPEAWSVISQLARR